MKNTDTFSPFFVINVHFWMRDPTLPFHLKLSLYFGQGSSKKVKIYGETSTIVSFRA